LDRGSARTGLFEDEINQSTFELSHNKPSSSGTPVSCMMETLGLRPSMSRTTDVPVERGDEREINVGDDILMMFNSNSYSQNLSGQIQQ
jgi:hypothetical protein